MNYNFKDKNTNVNQLNNYMLAKTLSMFEWENLPDSIPHRELEKILQVNGYAFITKVNGDFYALSGSLGGELDAYGNYTTITINNVFLKFNKTLSIKDDGVLISNDDMLMGVMPLYTKHNTMLIENDINMILHGYNTRIQTLISASDDKTKDNGNAYLKKIIDGEVGVIGETALFDGIKLQSANGISGGVITNMTEYHQYIKASLFNEIGLSANFNMKRERLTSGEVSQGEDSLFPYVYNMLKCRLQAVKKINTMFELKLNVAFGSVWHIKELEVIDDLIENPKTTPDEVLSNAGYENQNNNEATKDKDSNIENSDSTINADNTTTKTDDETINNRQTGDSSNAITDDTNTDNKNADSTDTDISNTNTPDTSSENTDNPNESTKEPLTNRNEPLNEPLTNRNEPLETPLPNDIESANKVNEIMELLTDDTLTDEDLKAIDELLAEIKGIDDDSK